MKQAHLRFNLHMIRTLRQSIIIEHFVNVKLFISIGLTIIFSVMSTLVSIGRDTPKVNASLGEVIIYFVNSVYTGWVFSYSGYIIIATLEHSKAIEHKLVKEMRLGIKNAKKLFGFALFNIVMLFTVLLFELSTSNNHTLNNLALICALLAFCFSIVNMIAIELKLEAIK